MQEFDSHADVDCLIETQTHKPNSLHAQGGEAATSLKEIIAGGTLAKLDCGVVQPHRTLERCSTSFVPLSLIPVLFKLNMSNLPLATTGQYCQYCLRKRHCLSLECLPGMPFLCRSHPRRYWTVECSSSYGFYFRKESSFDFQSLRIKSSGLT